jgi:hypothetical protein
LFFSLLGETFFPCIRPTVFDRDRAAFDPAQFARSPHKICDEGAPGCSRGSARNPMVGTFPACCTRAASGHATAALPMSVMNSRRFN